MIEGSTPTSFKVLRGKTKIVGFKDRVEFDGEFVAHIEGRGFGEGIPYLIDNEGVEPFPFIDPQSNRHRVEFDAENGLEMTMRNGPSLSLACEVEINVTSGIIKSKPWLMPIVVCSFYSSAMLG